MVNNPNKTVFPEDTKDTFYVPFETALETIIETCFEKFGPDIDIDLVQIGAEYHQVRCFGYDLYDPSDHMALIVVRYTGDL